MLGQLAGEDVGSGVPALNLVVVLQEQPPATLSEAQHLARVVQRAELADGVSVVRDEQAHAVRLLGETLGAGLVTASGDSLGVHVRGSSEDEGGNVLADAADLAKLIVNGTELGVNGLHGVLLVWVAAYVFESTLLPSRVSTLSADSFLDGGRRIRPS